MSDIRWQGKSGRVGSAVNLLLTEHNGHYRTLELVQNSGEIDPVYVCSTPRHHSAVHSSLKVGLWQHTQITGLRSLVFSSPAWQQLADLVDIADVC